ncbi:MAG: RNA methyltransferase [Flavobacteriales bacterium]|nr:RNA methyltransferase [Flavobacteriales bacterium]
MKEGISKAQIKWVKSLFQKKTRSETGLFVAEGKKIVEELLAGPVRVEAVFSTTPVATDRCPVYVGSPADLTQMSALSTPPGILAIGVQPEPAPFAIPAGLILALDNIHDPGNMGTLIRTAEWFGVEQCWCSADCVELWNPKVIQSGMGSVFRMPVRHTDLAHDLDELISHGIPVYAGLLGAPSHRTIKTRKPAVVLIGSESHGISEALQQLPLTTVSIVQRGPAESLNAAVAGGVLLEYFSG